MALYICACFIAVCCFEPQMAYFDEIHRHHFAQLKASETCQKPMQIPTGISLAFAAKVVFATMSV